MKISRTELRILLLHEYRLGRTSTEAWNNICATMGEGVLSKRMVQHWFNKFIKGNFDLDDLPRCGRPVELDIDKLNELIEQEPRLTHDNTAIGRGAWVLSYHNRKKFEPIG